MDDRLDPIHPGEILREEFLVPLNLRPEQLAERLSLSPDRVRALVDGRHAITADTALRLARHFGTSEGFWSHLQADYDREVEADRLRAPLKGNP